VDGMDVNARSCLDTLSSVPHKARLVRSMAVHWRTKPVMVGTTLDALNFVGNTLLAVTSLKHLYLRFRGVRSETIREIIYPLLKWNILLHANPPSTEFRNV
jgi:hypothetical protein